MSDITTLRQEVFDYVRLMLGGQMVKIELDADHYNMALDQALTKFRQVASNSVEESYAFLELIKDQQEYTLDSNIMQVRKIYRRSIGSSGTGSDFLPFEAAYINMYMMQAGRVGGMATYELYTGYQELASRMFGGFINFKWEPVSKKMTIVRKTNAEGETVLLHIDNKKPDVTLLSDPYILPWLQKYTLGLCLIMLGRAYSKFSTIVGPGGGTTLNGDALKAEGTELLAECMLDISNYVVGNEPLSWIIG